MAGKLLLGGHHGPYPVKTGYGRAGAVSSTGFTPGRNVRMKPLGFLTGVVLGSAASIALVLGMVVVIFALTGSQQPVVGREYPGLLLSAGLFAVLSAAAAVAFTGLQRERPWRWLAQAAMWLAMAAIGWYYWPASG